MKHFFQRLRSRRAHRRLERSLNLLLEDQLEMAACLNLYLREFHLVPGDRITLYYDGEHAGVALTEVKNSYFRKRDEQLFQNLNENET